MTRLGFNSNI